MRKNVAGQFVIFNMLDTAGAPVTSGTPTVRVTLNNGTQANGGGSTAHKGNGDWAYLPTQAETNHNHVAYKMLLAGAIPQTINLFPSAVDLQTNAHVNANVTQFGGTNGTFSGGRPEVNATHWGGTAVASALVRGNIIQVGGSAVSGVADFRADVSGIPAAVWGHGTRTLSAFGFSVTVGTNSDKTGYSLAADQAVNVTKVGGNAVTGPDDFKADLSGIPAAVWGHSSRTLSAFAFSVTVGTNNDKTGYSLTQAFPANFPSLGINASGDISRVTLVDTTTANSDMRGTDGANTTTPPTVGAIADAVWDELLSAHTIVGSTGAGVAAAGSSGDPWATALPGAYGSGSAGYIVGTNLDAQVSGISGGGGGGTDWTADERTVIRAVLGIPTSGTTPADPSTGILHTIRNAVLSVPANVWSATTRTLSAFGFNVTVGTNNDKTGYSLAADQPVNVTKVNGTLVAGPNDFKADLSGIPAAVWGHGSRTLSAFAFDVTVGGYATGQGPGDLVDLTGIPGAVWGHGSRTLSAFAFNVGLIADQAVNVTKVGGTNVTGPNDLKADLSGVPAAVWGHGSRTLSAFGFSVTVGTNNDKTGYGLAVDQAVNVTKVAGSAVSGVADFRADLSGVPGAVWGHGSRTLSAFAFNVTVGGYASGQSPAALIDVSQLAAKSDLPADFHLMLINNAGQVSASNVSVTVNPTVLDPASVTAIQDPILAAISVIAPAAADYAIKADVKFQGNGVANAKVALVGTTAAALSDSNGLAQLNVSANQVYQVRVTVPDGYQFVPDFPVEVLTADVTVPINLVALSLPSIVPPLRVTYDEIRRHVGRFLGFGANPDQFEDSQARAVEDTIRQGLRDYYFPSINGAPYEWSFLKRYIELAFTGGNTFVLPNNFVRLASQVTVPGLGYPLRQVSESALRSMAIDSNEQGDPIYFALAADGDALQLGVTLYQMRLFPTPPPGTGHAEFWYHTTPEIDLDTGGPLGGTDMAATIIECCLARAELAQNVESLSQGGGIHLGRSQEMLRRSIEADRALQSETLAVSMAEQMRPPQQ